MLRNPEINAELQSDVLLGYRINNYSR